MTWWGQGWGKQNWRLKTMADTQGIENLWRSARQGEPGSPPEQNRDQPGGEEEELEESVPLPPLGWVFIRTVATCLTEAAERERGEWLTAGRYRLQLEGPDSLQQHLDFWGETSTTEGRERRGKEAEENNWDREGTVTCCLPWIPGSIPTWGCRHWAVSVQSLQH